MSRTKQPKFPLPRTQIELRLPNPDWITSGGDFYITVSVDAEVLSVSFNAGTMRVRTVWQGEVFTYDVDATPFFEKFTVVAT